MFMIFELLRWWYVEGWLHSFKRIGSRTHNVALAFSAPTLLRTLFAPWRRIVTTAGRSIDAKFQAAIDNFVSRLVGFISRFIVLIAALVMTTGTFIMSCAIALTWPLVPLLVVYFIVKGISS